MEYIKPPLSFEEQVDLLLNRGMIVQEKSMLLECLKNVNYTRLSAYWYTFQDFENNDLFLPDTNFETIWQRYIFDHHLRMVVMDALGFIEVSILQTRMVEKFTLKYGPFGHIKKESFAPYLTKDTFDKMIFEIDKEIQRRRRIQDEVVCNYFDTYTSETHMPLWLLAECLSFGNLVTLFKNLKYTDKKEVARQFNVPSEVLQSWLMSLNYTRNLCAHHDRLWNREWRYVPAVPNGINEWRSLVDNRRIFLTLSILNYLIKQINPKHNWGERIKKLISNYPEIPTQSMMGFPEDWLNNPLWQDQGDLASH